MPRLLVSLALLLISVSTALSASLDGLAVEVVNQTEPELCAERDNVAVSFTNPKVHSFRIEAAHPVYLSTGLFDNWEADWTACDLTADPDFKPAEPPKRRTVYEEPGLWLIGYEFPNFWRPATAKVRVGDRVETGLHMLQLWVVRSDGAEEVLVFYPQDGYWRPRPMTPAGMRNTAYGSSFLVGPIEVDHRPLVKINEVAFDPKTRTFTLNFTRGGTGKVRVADLSQHRIALDVGLSDGVAAGPFAMVRSMYVTEFNNDAARIAVRERNAKGWREESIMKFDRATATDAWIGRLSPSQHNTSSPDLVLNSFSDGPTPKRPKAEPPPPKL